MEYQFAYIIWGLLYLPAWLLFFLLRPDLRKPMLTMGLIFLPLAPLAEFTLFLGNYWNPVRFTTPVLFTVQELIFVFLIVGVMTAFFPTVAKIKLGESIKWNNLLILLGLAFITIVILFFGFGVRAILAVFSGQIVSPLILWIYNPKLIKGSAESFFFGSALAFLVFLVMLQIYPSFVSDWWLTERLLGIFIAGVPVEEILWLGVTGLGFGLMPSFIWSHRND